MPDREFYKKQISRLSALGPLPSTSEGIGELIDTLMRFREQDAHRIVSEIVYERGFTRCPRVDELLAVAYDVLGQRGQQEQPKPHADCADCGGTGWKPVKRGDYDGVEKCSHTGGKLPPPEKAPFRTDLEPKKFPDPKQPTIVNVAELKAKRERA